MVDTEVWTQITPLEFKNSFAHLWRGKDGDWQVKLADYVGTIDLKAETLKAAFDEVKDIYLEKKYLQPKKRKIAREGRKAKPKPKKAKKNVTKTKTSK
jgi:hypothetical protein